MSSNFAPYLTCKPNNEDVPRSLIAVKKLNSKDRKIFEQEVKILRKLSQDNHKHDHLITLLATYERSGDFCIIFPLASSDLFGFWKDNAHPERTSAMARWIAEQFRGLAEGLKRIHQWETFSGSSVILEHEAEGLHEAGSNEKATKYEKSAHEHGPIRLIGRHGDLKPENILWFPNTRGFGTLKITDFGIARFSKDYSRKGHVPNSESYCSPEYVLDREHSPACDVWALGCIFLEMITWFCGGYELCKQSAENRSSPDPSFSHGRLKIDRFFTTYEDPGQKDVMVAKVKDAVVQVSQASSSCKLCADLLTSLAIGLPTQT